MPTDRSCRTSHGGCGRPVVVVREPSTRQPFGGVLKSNYNSHLIAVHDDEIEETPGRVAINATVDQFNRFRLQLELRCAAHHEQLKAAV